MRTRFLACTFTNLLLCRTVKLLAIFLRFQTEEQVLRDNKSKISGGKAFNGDNLQLRGNHGSTKDKERLCREFLQIFDWCFNI